MYASHWAGTAALVALTATLAGYGIALRGKALASRERAGRTPLQPLEVAMLVGGEQRLAETVIAGLVADGLVRVGRDGTLSVVETDPPSPARSRLDRIAFDTIQAGASRVLVEARRHFALAEVSAALARRGLRASVRAVDPRVPVWFLLSLVCVLVVSDAFGAASATASERTVGTVLGAVALAAAWAVARPLERERRADRRARALRETRAAWEATPDPSRDARYRVAYEGFQAYPDEDVSAGLRSCLERVSRPGGTGCAFAGCEGGCC